MFAAGDQTLTLSVRNGRDLFQIQAGLQHIPYQGFVNQPMDMTFNEQWFFNTHYLGHYDWGTLDLRAYFQRTLHEMNFLADKLAVYSPGSSMPMDTDGKDFGYSIKAEIPTSRRDVLRIGNEFHGQHLDDWWPPVPGTAPWMGQTPSGTSTVPSATLWGLSPNGSADGTRNGRRSWACATMSCG